jgi:hypothetical protein
VKRDAERERRGTHFKKLEEGLDKQKCALIEQMAQEGATQERIQRAVDELEVHARHERRKSVHLMRGMQLYRSNGSGKIGRQQGGSGRHRRSSANF